MGLGMTYEQMKMRLCLKLADKWATEAQNAKNEKEAEHAREMQQRYLDKIQHLFN